MKVEKLMNAPEVKVEKNGVKTIIPNSIDNLESAVDESNVLISPVERQAIKDSQINKKHMSELFSELAEKAVVLERKVPEDTTMKVQNIYTKSTKIDESVRRKRRLTLEEFATFHKVNRNVLLEKKSRISEATHVHEKDDIIDSASTVYNTIRDRMFYLDSNSERGAFYDNADIKKTPVRCFFVRDAVKDKGWSLSSDTNKKTMYSAGSELSNVAAFNMRPYDVGVLVPSKEDAVVAKSIADFFSFDCDLIKLNARQRDLFPIEDQFKDEVDDMYAVIIRIDDRYANKNIAEWFNFIGRTDVPYAAVKKALSELSKSRRAELEKEMGYTKDSKKSKSKD